MDEGNKYVEATIKALKLSVEATVTDSITSTEFKSLLAEREKRAKLAAIAPEGLDLELLEFDNKSQEEYIEAMKEFGENIRAINNRLEAHRCDIEKRI